MRLNQISAKRKKMLPVAIFIIMTIIFSVLIYQEIRFEVSKAKKDSQRELQFVSTALNDLITKPIERMKGLEAYFEANPDFESEALRDMAVSLYDPSRRIVKTVALSDQGVVKFIYPLKGSENVVGVDLTQIEAQKEETIKVLETGQSSLVGPLNVIEGWSAYIYISALHADKTDKSKITGLLTLVLDDAELLEDSGIQKLLSKYQVKIVSISRDFKEKTILDATKTTHSDFVSVDIYPVDKHWKISVYPKEGWPIRYDIIVLLMLLWLALTSALTALTVVLLKRNDKLKAEVELRTKELTETNCYLEESLAENEERQALLELVNAKLETTISELKNAQNRVLALEKINTVNHMMNGIAHQLNTPLGSINLMLSQLKLMLSQHSKLIETIGESDVKDFYEVLEIIENSNDKAIRIISNFKALTYVYLHQEMELIHLRDLIADIAAEILFEKGLTLVNHIPADAEIICNKPMMEEAISKLMTFFAELSNKEKSCAITIDMDSTDGVETLNVRFANIAVSESIRGMIFEPHLMLPSTKLTGLELFIASMIIIQMLSGNILYTYEGDDNHLFNIFLTGCSGVE